MTVRHSLRGLAQKFAPLGPDQAADGQLVTTGTVYSFDPVKATVTVGVRGGVVTLPANPDLYVSGGLARVLMDPIRQRPILVLAAVNPAAPVVVAPVTATTGATVTVTWTTGPIEVPVVTGSYTVGQSAWVQLDRWGTPVAAVGASTIVAPGSTPTPPPSTSRVVTATVTIGPQVSGTWQSSQSRWNNWNASRYGGPSNIWQGSAYGSGPLLGFAGYGNQIVNLHAISILSITMRARKNDTNGNSAQLTVQGSPSGSRPAGAPSSSGDTASTGNIPPGGWDSLTFTTNMRSAFRTGAAKGLVAVGSDYGGFGGTATPGSFVLRITYTKNA